jgi:hypothetical protein
MADLLPSAIADDLVIRLSEALDPIPVVYGPPENAPESLLCWVRYGPVEFEWGMLIVRAPTVTVTVGIKRGGQYMSEYRFVNDTAHLVASALSGFILIADEAPITSVSITEPTEITYPGGPLMAAVVNLTIETKGIAAL